MICPLRSTSHPCHSSFHVSPRFTPIHSVLEALSQTHMAKCCTIISISWNQTRYGQPGSHHQQNTNQLQCPRQSSMLITTSCCSCQLRVQRPPISCPHQNSISSSTYNIRVAIWIWHRSRALLWATVREQISKARSNTILTVFQHFDTFFQTRQTVLKPDKLSQRCIGKCSSRSKLYSHVP